jgi:hypothetical protein
MLFIDNKYTKIYYSIISNAQSRDLSQIVYSEKHHIVPECFFKIRKRKGPAGHLDGNVNADENIVRLTAREHFICHWLLTKMVDNIYYEYMLYALNGMRRENKHQIRYYTKITGRVFAKLREELSEKLRARFKGRIISEETKQKMRKPKSAEARKNMIAGAKDRVMPPSKLKGRKLTSIHKEKLKISHIHGKPMLGKTHSNETKERMKKSSANREKKECPLCQRLISINAFGQHYRYCLTLN